MVDWMRREEVRTREREVREMNHIIPKNNPTLK